MHHFIITGHSQFSTGLLDAVKMIASSIDNIEAVPFLDGESSDKYAEKIETIYEKYSEKNIIFFTDLLGGTPFKTCVQQKIDSNSNSEVISGSNLALILEAVTLGDFIEDPKELCQMAINSGKENITLFEMEQFEDEEEFEDEDGI